MANTFVCPHCKKNVELSQAFKHDIEEKIKAELAGQESIELTDLKKALKEKEEKIREQREQELALREEKRKLEEREKDLKLEVQRQVDEEKKKLEEQVFKQAAEEHKLKDMEKEKKISDMEKLIEELKRKAQQGSQQTQGEVLELELEELLKREFPTDEIKPVPKGIRGADVIQTVLDRAGRKCGTILWESKNAKWSETWTAKLKEDQRAVNAHVAVLVSVNLPADTKNFSYRNGIWVTGRESTIGLASALRINIGQVFHAKLATDGKNEKMEVLFNYLTGNEFTHRIEAMVEIYKSQKEELEKEKRWFASKWARQEKMLDRGQAQILGVHGDLEGLLGSSMPQVKGMELESGE